MGALSAETEYRLMEVLGSTSDHARLRAAAGWSELAPEAMEAGLERSLYSVCMFRGEQAVGQGMVLRPAPPDRPDMFLIWEDGSP